MHTILLMAGGVVLLLCGQLLARFTGIASQALAALYFLPLWLLIAATNMWAGIRAAGYSMQDELPIFLLVFSVPACMALMLWHQLRR
jgi:hypothetical protein